MITNWAECKAVELDPNKLSGKPVFKGSRVPVAALFENLQSGATIYDFLEWFQGITIEQVNEVMQFTTKSLEEHTAA